MQGPPAHTPCTLFTLGSAPNRKHSSLIQRVPTVDGGYLVAARTKDHWLVQTEKGLSESSARAVETESRGRDASTMGTGSLSLPLPACLKSTLLGNHR